jgi:hypothetical protein
MSFFNYLREIHASSNFVVQQARDVTISDEMIDKFVGDDEMFPSAIDEVLDKIQWDSAGWHFCCDAAQVGWMTAQYIFVLDALNFCFWPCKNFEYENLAVSLKIVFEENPESFSAKYLSEISEVGFPFTFNVCLLS